MLVLTFQEPFNVSGQAYLDSCIHDILKRSLQLQQKNLFVEQAREVRNAMKSNLLPAVNIQGGYTTGEGGRTISIPAGDLLNPVYETLNKLTSRADFYPVQNVNDNFIPNNFFDGKIRATMPVFNSENKFDKSISGLKIGLAESGVIKNKRQLVFDIKSAYFSYLALINAVKIYDSTLAVVKRIVNINASLYKNGKILYTNYLRSQTESLMVQSQLAEVKNQTASARMLFNYLLNRDLESEIIVEMPPLNIDSAPNTELSGQGVQEDLKLLAIQAKIDQLEIRRAEALRMPRVNAILDVGSQTSGWKFDHKAWYYQAAIQFSIPLFNGQKNYSEIKFRKLKAKQTEIDLTSTAESMKFTALVAANELKTAKEKCIAAGNQVTACSDYYRVVEKTYTEGLAQLTELLDARNKLTAAWLLQMQSLFEVFIATAKLEKETGSFRLQE